jgi:hypothetical protein
VHIVFEELVLECQDRKWSQESGTFIFLDFYHARIVVGDIFEEQYGTVVCNVACIGVHIVFEELVLECQDRKWSQESGTFIFLDFYHARIVFGLIFDLVLAQQIFHKIDLSKITDLIVCS